jgi:hypothetical protein
MEDAVFLISDSIITAAFLCIAIRLLHRSFMTHAAPERLLGASFLLWGLSYPLYDVPYALAVEEIVMAPLAYASRISWHVGTALLALFVKQTFRKSDSRASGIVVGVIALLAGGGMGSVWVGDYGGDFPLSNPWWWLEWAGSVIPMIWISMEASVYYLKIRQHRWLGEGDALLLNRMGIWCLVGVSWVLIECLSAAQYVIFESTQRWLVSLSFALMALELIGVAMIWLVFYPPAAYRHWINRPATPHTRAV